MRKLAFALLCTGSLVLSACGGDDGDDVDVADASTTPDAATQCNPITQSGCDAGEKCAQLVERSDDPETEIDEFLARTACVPDGTVAVGEECESGEPGPMGYDNCQAGSACNDVCVEICDVVTQNGCPADKTCVRYADTFTDVNEGNTGLCAPSCDLLTHQLIVDGEVTETVCESVELSTGDTAEGACQLNMFNTRTSCSIIFPDATEGTQDKPCWGPDATSCYSNGCQKGYGLTFFNEEQEFASQGQKRICAANCLHEDVYKETADGPTIGSKTGVAGDFECDGTLVAGGLNPDQDYDCRNFQDFIDTRIQLPDNVDVSQMDRTWGFCTGAGLLPLFGDCDGLIKEDLVEAFDDDGVDDNDEYCGSDLDENPDTPLQYDVSKCPVGCVSTSTYLEWLPPMGENTARGAKLRKMLIPRVTPDGIMINGEILERTQTLGL